jgi:hypothetical protein
MVFEHLESRQLLGSQPLNFTAYFPEGYSADHINEFVPITNPNDFAVEYELHARYEWGERDQLLWEGVVPAHTRGGVTISEATRPLETLARKDVPYALVLKASDRLAATLSHYDFNVAIGESFTTNTSDRWSFGDGWNDSAESRDYLLFYNPSDEPVSVTTTFYGSAGTIATTTQSVGGQRRSGLSIDDLAILPEGKYAAVVTATHPIVASQSHYEPSTGRGYGTMGASGDGSTSGVIPSVSFENDYRLEGEATTLLEQGKALEAVALAQIEDYLSFAQDYLTARGTTFFSWYGITVGQMRTDLRHHVPGIGYRYGESGTEMIQMLQNGRAALADLEERWARDRVDYYENNDGWEVPWDQQFADLDLRINDNFDQYRDWFDSFDRARPSFDEDIRLHGGDGDISILNAGSSGATVNMVIVYADGSAAYQEAINVPARSRRSLSVRDLPLHAGDFGMRYTSSRPVTITASIGEGADGTGVTNSSFAATLWDFGEGYMSRSRGGGSVTEDVFVYNPASASISVTIELMTTDGQVLSYGYSIGARSLRDVKLHAIDSLRMRAEDQWYGIRVVSTAPVVALLEHWDQENGGGFATLGMPSGAVVSLN